MDAYQSLKQGKGQVYKLSFAHWKQLDSCYPTQVQIIISISKAHHLRTKQSYPPTMWASTLSLGTVLSFAAVTAADSMYVQQECFTAACSHVGEFITDYGRWFIYNMRDGCHGGQGVPGLEVICIDYTQARAHFKFSHQGNKRCMRGDWTKDDACGINACGTWWFHETPCTWREALEIDEGGNANRTEEVESVSALPEPTPEAVRFKA